MENIYPKEWHELAERAGRNTEDLELFVSAVLTAAARKLEGIPVTCTALTGPVWYGEGFKEATDLIRDFSGCPNIWLTDQLKAGPETH